MCTIPPRSDAPDHLGPMATRGGQRLAYVDLGPVAHWINLVPTRRGRPQSDPVKTGDLWKSGAHRTGLVPVNTAPA